MEAVRVGGVRLPQLRNTKNYVQYFYLSANKCDLQLFGNGNY